MRQYEKQTLFDACAGGLDYIQEVYPQSKGFENKNRGFAIRPTDRTASAHLHELNGVWYIKDFGDSDKGKNAVDLCMQEENLDFLGAMKFLYQKYGLEAKTMQQFKPVREYKATDKDKDWYDIVFYDTPQDTKVFAPFLDADTCADYNFRQVKSYQYVSFRKDAAGNATEEKNIATVTATDDYPIFAFVEEGFTKIYEPKNDKAFRFRFFGKKPERFIYGWQRIFDKVNLDRIKELRQDLKETDDAKETKWLQQQLDEEMLDCVYIASGGSDGLNIASLGGYSIWFNNETEQIDYSEYQQLKEVCKNIYNIPDLDATGVKAGVKLGLEFIDLKTIWLPLDYANSNKKDFRDWIGNYKHLDPQKAKTALEKLQQQALEFRWWRWNKKTASYKYNYVSLLYFLEHQGFAVYKLSHKNQQKGSSNYIFIKIEGNIVKEVTAPEIKSFVQDWLRQNQISLDVLNMVIGSQFLNEKSLLSLPIKELDFKVASQKDQLYFFDNKTIRVAGDGITDVTKEKIKCHVWADKVIQHNIKLDAQPQFSIFKDASGNWDIEVSEKNNMFLNYLVNASRIHWRNELETPFEGKSEKLKEEYHNANRFNIAGPKLTPDEIHEQKQHLINKIYSLGYILHTYKDAAKPWCLYIMDNKLPEVAHESHGGSGKSFGVTSIFNSFKNTFYMEGRNTKLLDNNHVYDGLDEDTDVIFLDDAHYTLNFGFFFSVLTGSIKVNPKHGKPFEIPFGESPKMCITTNYVPSSLEPSVLRRLQFMVYSDYYHEKTEEYKETRQISDDFGGRKMFDEHFTKTDWNLFYNFCLQALQFYLSSTERFNAPDGNVKKRNLMQQIGNEYKEWALGYFSEDKLNTFIDRKVLQLDYKEFAGGKSITSNMHKKKLGLFCELQGWVFNPVEYHGSDGLIKRERYDEGKRNSVEHYYIKTAGVPLAPVDEVKKASDAKDNSKTTEGGEPGEDLPF